jgi:hypothetical protein
MMIFSEHKYNFYGFILKVQGDRVPMNEEIWYMFRKYTFKTLRSIMSNLALF